MFTNTSPWASFINLILPIPYHDRLQQTTLSFLKRSGCWLHWLSFIRQRSLLRLTLWPIMPTPTFQTLHDWMSFSTTFPITMFMASLVVFPTMESKECRLLVSHLPFGQYTKEQVRKFYQYLEPTEILYQYLALTELFHQNLDFQELKITLSHGINVGSASWAGTMWACTRLSRSYGTRNMQWSWRSPMDSCKAFTYVPRSASWNFYQYLIVSSENFYQFLTTDLSEKAKISATGGGSQVIP